MIRLAYVLSILFISSPALAAECPFMTITPGYNTETGHFDVDKAIAGIKAAPDCETASELYKSCVQGNDGDADTNSAAIDKCESEFLPKLNKGDKAKYKKASKDCDNAEYDEGTIAKSELKECYLNLAEDYAKRFGKKKVK